MVTRVGVRSALWGLAIYLFWAFVSWEISPGDWAVDERGPAAALFAIGVVAIWIWELD